MSMGATGLKLSLEMEDDVNMTSETSEHHDEAT